MIRERVLTISTLTVLTAALSGAAHAGPTITNKNYSPSDVRPSSRPVITQTEPNGYSARAMHRRGSSALTGPAVNSDRQGCRYLGGPKYPTTC